MLKANPILVVYLQFIFQKVHKMKKILIIEDDPSIQLGVKVSFEEEGYEVITSSDGENGYKSALSDNPDIILLDIMLPLKNGYDVCRDLRIAGCNIPVIMLTSKKEEMDKIIALEIGADDYITKPFSIRELQARVKAILRRSSFINEVKNLDNLEFGQIKLNLKKQEVLKNNKVINLSAREFQIIKYLIEHEGEVISREMLLDDVWGYENFPTTRTVDNYILNIRKLIEDDPSKPAHILTVHTVGYKFQK